MEAEKGNSLGKWTIVCSVGIAQESVTGVFARRSGLVYLGSSISHPSLRQRVLHLSVDLLAHKSSISSIFGVYSVLEWTLSYFYHTLGRMPNAWRVQTCHTGEGGGGDRWCAAINLALNSELNLDVVLSWQFDLSSKTPVTYRLHDRDGFISVLI